MSSDEINLADLAVTLEKSPDYRVLRRLTPRTDFIDSNGQPTKIGILLDVETTGLDTAKHEVIELGMIKFAYLPDGRIVRIIDVFESFNEPLAAIPEEITELTGITDTMVAGHRIDTDAVTSFSTDAVVVIAHNAHFDRKFAERYWPIFETKGWACSATEIEWRNMDSTAHASDICSPGSAGFTKPIVLPMIAGPFLRSWLHNCPRLTNRHLRLCLIALGARRYGFGLSNLLST
jgi:hypothetical protein